MRDFPLQLFWEEEEACEKCICVVRSKLETVSSGIWKCNMSSRKRERIVEQTSHKVIEKRRRDRINNCLLELSQTVPAAFSKHSSGKLEKAEILEMTVEYLRAVQTTEVGMRFHSGEWYSGDIWGDFAQHYHTGFSQCVREVLTFLADVEDSPPHPHPNHHGALSDSRSARLLSFLHARFKSQLPASAAAAAAAATASGPATGQHPAPPPPHASPSPPSPPTLSFLHNARFKSQLPDATALSAASAHRTSGLPSAPLPPLRPPPSPPSLTVRASPPVYGTREAPTRSAGFHHGYSAASTAMMTSSCGDVTTGRSSSAAAGMYAGSSAAAACVGGGGGGGGKGLGESRLGVSFPPFSLSQGVGHGSSFSSINNNNNSSSSSSGNLIAAGGPGSLSRTPFHITSSSSSPSSLSPFKGTSPHSAPSAPVPPLPALSFPAVDYLRFPPTVSFLPSALAGSDVAAGYKGLYSGAAPGPFGSSGLSAAAPFKGSAACSTV